MDQLYFDDLEVGQEWVSAERTVSEADIVTFADLTGDRHPSHLDPEYARTTPFRRPTAHCLLGLSLAGGLGMAAPPLRVQALLALREWQFREPVYIGDTVRVRQRVAGKEPRASGRRGVVLWATQVLNQDGRVVQEGATVLLVEGRGGRRGRSPAA